MLPLYSLLVVLLVFSPFSSATKQIPFEINEAYTQLMYSYAAYCPEATVQPWSCYYCTYNASLTTKGFKVTSVIKNAITNTFGYVGVQGNNVEVVFRGTQSNSLTNWIEDLAAAKGAPYPNVPGATVHAGFYDTYVSVRAAVRSAVTLLVNQTKPAKVIFTGHSLGAALATLAAVDITPLLDVPTVVYNYGSPRVGNQAFQTFYQKLISTTYRIVNMNDMVPHLPTASMGFHHVAQEVWWNTKTHYEICNMSGEDPLCSDSILVPNIPPHLDYLGIHEGDGGC